MLHLDECERRYPVFPGVASVQVDRCRADHPRVQVRNHGQEDGGDSFKVRFKETG